MTGFDHLRLNVSFGRFRASSFLSPRCLDFIVCLFIVNCVFPILNSLGVSPLISWDKSRSERLIGCIQAEALQGNEDPACIDLFP